MISVGAMQNLDIVMMAKSESAGRLTQNGLCSFINFSAAPVIINHSCVLEVCRV